MFFKQGAWLFKNNTQNYGYGCDWCQSFIQLLSSHFVKNRRKAFCDKYCTFVTIESLCNGTRVFDSDKSCKKYTSVLLKTHDWFLSALGTELKSKLLTLKNMYCEMNPKVQSTQNSLDFIMKKFILFYNNHGPKIQETVVWGLLKYTINVFEGQPNSKIGTKLMDFFF